MKPVRNRLQRFKKITAILFLCSIFFTVHSTLLAVNSYAAIPKLINYQGVLRDSAGKSLNGAYNVTFRLYDTAGGGSPLWSETHTGVTIDRGIFSIMIGGVTPLDLSFDRQYYLGIQVGSDPEMFPRQLLASSAYAFTSENVTGVVPIANGGTAATTVSNALNNLLPSQSGNSGKFLRTDGAHTNWSLVIPDDGTVSQAKLKTAVGEVSSSTKGENLTLPGGEYGFYPQIKFSWAGVNNAYWYAYLFYGGTTWSDYRTNVYVHMQDGQTIYIKQRYVTASGQDHWIFLLLDKSTKNIIASYSAPDHPSYGNGGDPNKVPHPFSHYDPNKHEICILDNTTIASLKLESKDKNI
jgi:hypothetical protein